MPAVSKKQQSFFALVNAYKKHKISPDKVSDEVKRTARSISDEDAHHFAATKRNGLPERKGHSEKKASPLDYMFVQGFLSKLREQ